ncbi:hypothetical protein DID88_008512 [Monilinia fructigena]|uniref:Uncharacterized protein n=1 Tax=Monilinia fructigena TaxID=38457 RepID=A0A395J5J8_9HELO|nr:hypothetical protein DID88_008512 [Monilinia fructigena]
MIALYISEWLLRGRMIQKVYGHKNLCYRSTFSGLLLICELKSPNFGADLVNTVNMSRTPLFLNFAGDSKRNRQMSWLLASSSRRKERRWPLVLRFWKGSIHSEVLWPVAILSAISAIVVYLNQHISSDVTLPTSIVPSLSIVMSYTTPPCTCSSTRSPQLSSDSSSTPNESSTDSPAYKDFDGAVDEGHQPLSKALEAKTIETVKIMIAMLYTVKNHLRADWGVELSAGTFLSEEGQIDWPEEYKELLPQGFKGHEHMGLGLTLQLATYVEKFINIGCKKAWFNNSASSQMLSELNQFVAAYGNMEVIRLAPTPVAHLIHSKQTLALFCCILPFAMAAEIGWWTVPLVAFVAFALYGIEGIAQWHEDPFGRDKIDINMDDIVDDARREIDVMLEAWKKLQGLDGKGLFTPSSSAPFTPRAEYGTLV